MESRQVYLLNLGYVGKNAAAFGVFTHYSRQSEGHWEVRAPSLVSLDTVNEALATMDMFAPVIENWPSFYAWLGRKRGWAGFTPQSAAELVPHWLGETVDYNCVAGSSNGFKFIDVESHVLAVPEIEFNLVGESPDDDAREWLGRIHDNLAFTLRPLFA